MAAGGRTDYVDVGEGVVAFVRHADESKYLVLVNLTAERTEAKYGLLNGAKALRGNTAKGDKLELTAYSYSIYELD